MIPRDRRKAMLSRADSDRFEASRPHVGTDSLKFVGPDQWFKRFYLAAARSVSAPGAREIQYTNQFRRDLATMGMEDCYYPTGSAANGSLLYCLVRIVRESPVQTILELGCGESTKLLSALRAFRPFDILSVESDPFWRNHIADLVDHEIALCPLEPRNIEGKRVDCYAWTEEILQRRFDFIVVDGPRATRRFSRWGALEVIAVGSDETHAVTPPPCEIDLLMDGERTALQGAFLVFYGEVLSEQAYRYPLKITIQLAQLKVELLQLTFGLLNQALFL